MLKFPNPPIRNYPELTGSVSRLKIWGDGILSRSKWNPFSNWNVAFVPYCSQDLWTGRTSRRLSTGQTIFFAGQKIFETSVKKVFASKHFKKSEEVMVSGISAGAVGVLSNWDIVKKNLAKANRKIRRFEVLYVH